jgi:hypothetical protein
LYGGEAVFTLLPACGPPSPLSAKEGKDKRILFIETNF